MRYLILSLLLLLGPLAAEPTPKVLATAQVKVDAEGGGALVRFHAVQGRRLRIRLVSTGLEPYGYLEWPGGEDYRPANQGSREGANQWEGLAPATGDYQLTVFDGSGQGGLVAVTVEELKEPAVRP